jgi:hypothetical protein
MLKLDMYESGTKGKMAATLKITDQPLTWDASFHSGNLGSSHLPSKG